MCGICGYINLNKSEPSSETIIKDMVSTLARRGPDDEGLYIKGNVALGHKRLSIIDLETGHQPMYNEDNSIVIVYNGEVYNFPELKKILSEKGHVFSTHSDTEVILHAYEEYGEDCLKRFNGMFALAIWDSKKEKLFLARDRFGKKPLYYTLSDNQFIFGSELKAILKHPSIKKEIDLSALSKYLAYEYVPSPFSIFKNIYKLEPASKLSLDRNGRYKIERYWDLSFNQPKKIDLKETELRLSALLKESVRRRLISDVPLGVFLSGGIDSSSVVSMMAELMDPKEIKTFSIGFKEKSFDELSDARLVAGYFGTDHHEEILSPSTMLEIFPDILNILDEPFADSSIIPTYLVSRFTRQHVKVALGGDGGDELFLGYPSFLAHALNDCFGFVPLSMKKAALKLLTGMVPPSHRYMSLNLLAGRFTRGLDFSEEVRHQAWIGSLLPTEQKNLFLPDLKLDYDPFNIYEPTYKFFKKVAKRNSLDRAMYIYVNTYMTDDILAKVDRASMANSLEVRAPFLDTEFAEFATSIPASFKLRNFKTKWILKDMLKDRLPKQTLSKPKQGFGVPVGKWLKEDLRHLLFEAFDKSKIEREGIFDYRYIKHILNEYMANKNDMRKEIWCLFMFEMWYDRWM